MLHGIATVAYILAMMTYITFLATKKQPVGQAATTIIVIGFVSHTLAFLMRWKEFYDLNIALGMGGDILRATPLTNLYESLIFFVWCLILGYLIVEFKYKNRSFGAFVAPVAGLTLAFIEMSGVSKDIQPLVPALQSNWLLIHVFMSFISYSGFALAREEDWLLVRLPGVCAAIRHRHTGPPDSAAVDTVLRDRHRDGR
jgi:ABC-type transport system involved in cytochrome c biogenesis permease subunit